MAITHPGVQNPHCDPPALAITSWTGEKPVAWLPSPSVVVMDSIARTEQTQARVDGARDAIRTNGDNRAGAAAALTAGYLGTCQTNTSAGSRKKAARTMG